MTERIFISGVAGFLGSHLADALIAEGHEIVGIDNLIGGYRENVPRAVEFHQIDCNDLSRVSDLMKGCTLVYHCAATAYEGLSVFSPHLVMRNLVTAATGVFSAAIQHRVRRIINLSSMAIYGEQAVIPFQEWFTPNPVDPYGIGKLAADNILMNLCEVHDIEYNIAIPHNIIGPRQKYDDFARNVASIFINLMLQGRQPYIYGDGSQKRNFSFVSDCVDPLVKLGFGKIRDERFNIGPDDEFITVLELAERIAALLDFDLDPVFVPARPQEVQLATCSADKARRLLGYAPQVSLEDGLRQMINYIRVKGVKPFDYSHVELEIINEKTPRVWVDKSF